jgi:signal transduction histidine kinase
LEKIFFYSNTDFPACVFTCRLESLWYKHFAPDQTQKSGKPEPVLKDFIYQYEAFSKRFISLSFINIPQLSAFMKSSFDTRNRNTRFYSVKKIIFYFFSVVSLLGNIIDLYFLDISVNDVVFWINAVNLLIVLSVVILFNRKILDFWTSGFLIIYAFVINIFISLAIDTQNPEFEKYFLRETIFLGITIVCGGFILGKKHILYFSFMYLLFFTGVVILTNSPFLLKNSIVLNIAVLSFLGWIYYLLLLLEQGYSRQEELIHTLETKNSAIEKQNKELEALNKTKDRLMSIMAHDLKGAINGIHGFSHLLSKDIENERFDRIKRFTGIIHKSSRNSVTLLANLLDWVRSQTNAIEFHPTTFTATEVLTDLVDMQKDNMPGKQIEIRIYCPESLEITADKNMLLTILRNLLANAVKFTPDQGKIEIAAKKTDKSVDFTVSDTGIGIEKENIPKLFDKKSGFKRTGTDQETGTGLGLLICQEFVEQHGGRISVNSMPGLGSVFSFTIPQE